MPVKESISKNMPNEFAPAAQQGHAEVFTLGCRLNICESEAMAQIAQRVGLGDAVIVNTCAVTAEAVRQSKQKIRSLAKARPDAHIIVTGCAATIEAEKFRAMPSVCAVVDNESKTSESAWQEVSERLDNSNGTSSGKSDKRDKRAVTKPVSTAHSGSRVRGYVAVQNGCDHSCTFCIIPQGRGGARSVPIHKVVAEVDALVQSGRSEIVLTGVDLTSWGTDLEGDLRLGRLVQELLSQVNGLNRLRISSLDSAELDPQLLEAISDQRVMPHIHLSLQSGSNLILKRMKRRHSRDAAIETCQSLRKQRPDVAIGADLIAGFPTESEEHFLDTLNLFEDCGIDFAHVFAYSSREGTPAARMPQLGHDIVRHRAKRLREAADNAFNRFASRQQGTIVSVLREASDMGHSDHYARVHLTAAEQKNSSDVGSDCEVSAVQSVSSGVLSLGYGDIVQARITGRARTTRPQLQGVII